MNSKVNMLHSRPNLSHVGIYVWDIKVIEEFYCRTLDLVVTDRGVGRRFQNQLVFMSSQPNMHHQLALASGREPSSRSTVMQLSFKVTELDQLRIARARALANGATDMFGLNHGNAWSIYFNDPEGNLVEVYVDTPFYVPQPHGDPLELEKSDEQILRETEEACRKDPGFMLVSEWEQLMAQRLEADGAH
ncbi:catechol 2,3-dioxygenase [Bradyrhizobium sp. USDA 4369]